MERTVEEVRVSSHCACCILLDYVVGNTRIEAHNVRCTYNVVDHRFNA